MVAATVSSDYVVVTVHRRSGEAPTMTSKLSRFRRAVSVLAVEDRPDFKRVDASPVAYDDGSWLRPLA